MSVLSGRISFPLTHRLSFRLTTPFGRGRSGGVTPVPAFLRGWDPDYDAGTDGHYFVGNVSGSDSNDGSAAHPFKTPEKALTTAIAAGGQKTIRVYAEGLDYGPVDLSAFSGSDAAHKVKFTGYGTQKPAFTGAPNITTGWTRCTSADAGALGGVLGVNGSPVFKKTGIATTSVAGDGRLIGMCVVENDLMLPICQDAASISNPHITGNSASLYSTTSFATDGGSPPLLASVTLAGVIDTYTQAQLEKAWLVSYVQPNIVHYAPITSASGATVTITPAKQSQSNTVAKFSLLNVLPALKKGQFGFVDKGDGTVDVYIYPNDEAHLAAGIRIASASVVVNMSGTDYCIVEGIEIKHAGNGKLNGIGAYGALMQIGLTANSGHQRGIEVRHCKFRDQPAGHAVYTQTHSGLTLENCTFRDIYCRSDMFQRAVAIQYFTTASPNAKVLYLDMERIENEPIQFYGQKDAVSAYHRLKDTGLGAHSNLFNAYLGSDEVLHYAVETINCTGYATWQRSSGVRIGMCSIDHILADGDAVRDQMDENHPPVVPAYYLIFNITTRSTIKVGGGGPADGDGVSKPKPVDPMTIVVRNSICAGIAKANVDTIATIDSQHNVLLDATTNLGGVGPFDVQLASSAVFDGSTMNLKAGSPVIGLGGANLDDMLLALEAKYGVNLHRDINGVPFTKLDFHGCDATARGADDTTAPTLSSPTASAASSEAINIGVTTTEPYGGVYCVVTTNGSTPSAAQIVAGQDASGSAALRSGVLTNASAGAKSAAVSGLTPSTTYYVHWTHEDLHGNRSAVVSASAATDPALLGTRIIAQGANYVPSGASNGLVVPAVLNGDLLVAVFQILNGAYCSLNSLPAGWSQLGGGWNGTRRDPSITGGSGKPHIFAFVYPASANTAGQTLTFTTEASGTITASYHHIRGDQQVTVRDSIGTVSPAALPSRSLVNGDTALTIYSSFGTNGAGATPAPLSSTNATAFGVPDTPSLPADEGVWTGSYSSGNHPKWMALLKKVTATGTYSSPAPNGITNYCTYLIGLQP